MNSKRDSFFHPRTLIAVSLVMLIWIFWQNRMQKKYGKQKSTPSVESNEKTTNQISKAQQKIESNSTSLPLLKDLEQKESIWIYDKEDIGIQISSWGMGLKLLQLKKYVDRNKKQISFKSHLPGYPYDFSVAIEDSSGKKDIPYFQFIRSTSDKLEGIAHLKGIEIIRKITILEDNYTLLSEIYLKNKLQSASASSASAFSLSLVEKEAKIKKRSLFNPNFQYQNSIIHYKNKLVRTDLTKVKNDVFNQVDYIAFENQYFVKSLLNKSDFYPSVRIFPKENYVQTYLVYKLDPTQMDFKITNSMYIGPKHIDLLKVSDEKLTSIVSYGFFDSLAKPMLFLLKWFYKFIKNWGVAIILLTLFVRILLMPLNIFSYKSMQSMQAIQPLIKDIREKHKGDSQKINQEMMLLMRQYKVNPLGGCLPILFQFPVFIALYQVLGQSIELYQAPFMFWIKDLSLKDPFYILPLLMGISMFVQQKITPTTMDPAQAKIFMFIPIFFTFLMLNLPSGLTLYIFISTLFGILQQFFLMKGSAKSNNHVPASL